MKSPAQRQQAAREEIAMAMFNYHTGKAITYAELGGILLEYAPEILRALEQQAREFVELKELEAKPKREPSLFESVFGSRYK